MSSAAVGLVHPWARPLRMLNPGTGRLGCRNRVVMTVEAIAIPSVRAVGSMLSRSW